MNRAIVVGAGPVGLTVALLLARQGLRVAVVERQRQVHRGVRTVALDDECLRIWQSCGVEREIAGHWDGGAAGAVMCRYLTPGGRTFLRLRQCESELGYPQAVVVHEGAIVEALCSAAAQTPGIELRFGVEVAGLRQDASGVELELRAADGAASRERASWVVACDGAGSVVRRLLGVGMRGETLARPWLIANIDEEAPVYSASIRCDPRRPSVMVSIPHGVRRIECMLRPGEEERIERSADAVREVLAEVWPNAIRRPGIEAAVVRFEARVAERWRVGRVFLAGDAAHLTPPFAAQGLAAGLRDAANIAFKLAGASQGWLDPSVLDTYEDERRPHQERLIRLALRLGRLMAPRSNAEALVTQGLVRAATLLPFSDRLLHMRGEAIKPRYRCGFVGGGPLAGRYLPQPFVEQGEGRIRRLDELLGPRMSWIVTGSGASSGALPPSIDPGDDAVLVENRDFRDPARTLQAALGRSTAVLVRPDRIIHSHFPSFGESWRPLRSAS
jgi:3-(3-hydroxy-phenyl)propionate hydroxylase